MLYLLSDTNEESLGGHVLHRVKQQTEYRIAGLFPEVQIFPNGKF